MHIFDATQFQPQQGMPAHPAGMFDFQITNTFLKKNSVNAADPDGYQFAVEFTSPEGRIENRYNIFNKSEKAVEIAQKQLSALCHATGCFKLSFPNNPDGSPNMQMAGAELRGARGRMEVAPQRNNPDFMEVARVFDAQGNEPGRSGGQAAPQQQQQQPQQNGNAWGNQPNAAPQNPAPQAWGAPPVNAQPQQQPQAQPNPAPQANGAASGWQQNAQPNGGAAPPAWMR